MTTTLVLGSLLALSVALNVGQALALILPRLAREFDDDHARAIREAGLRADRMMASLQPARRGPGRDPR